jgi:hypothetical protein
VDGAVDAAATPQAGIGGIDNGLYLLLDNIPLEEF